MVQEKNQEKVQSKVNADALDIKHSLSHQYPLNLFILQKI